MKRIAVLVAGILLTVPGLSRAGSTGFDGFGLSGGVVSLQDTDIGDTMGFTAWLNMTTPTDRIDLRLFVDYWGKAKQLEVNEPESKIRDLSGGVLALYIIKPKNENYHPYVGVGIAAHSYETTNVPGVSVDEVKPGYHLGGGLGVRVNEGVDMIVEAWYIFAEPVDQFSGRVGAMFYFGSL